MPGIPVLGIHDNSNVRLNAVFPAHGNGRVYGHDDGSFGKCVKVTEDLVQARPSREKEPGNSGEEAVKSCDWNPGRERIDVATQIAHPETTEARQRVGVDLNAGTECVKGAVGSGKRFRGDKK